MLHQIEPRIGAGLAVAGAAWAPSDALQGQFKLFQPHKSMQGCRCPKTNPTSDEAGAPSL